MLKLPLVTRQLDMLLCRLRVPFPLLLFSHCVHCLCAQVWDSVTGRLRKDLTYQVGLGVWGCQAGFRAP